MSESTAYPGLPRVPLFAAGGLAVMTLIAVSFVQLTGIGSVRVPDAAVASVREFRFEDRANGSIVVLDARDNRLVETVAPESNGFLRGTMRGLARERKRQGVGPEVAFRLVGHTDGRLTLMDPGTGRRVDLESFGPTNAAAFAKLMATPQAAR